MINDVINIYLKNILIFLSIHIFIYNIYIRTLDLHDNTSNELEIKVYAISTYRRNKLVRIWSNVFIRNNHILFIYCVLSEFLKHIKAKNI